MRPVDLCMKRNLQNKISLFFNALRNAFISLIPFYILQSAIILVSVAISIWDISYGIINIQNVTAFSQAILSLFPILIITSISHFLAVSHNINRNISIALSLLILVAVEHILHSLEGTTFSIGQMNTFFSIVTPVFSIFLLNKFEKNVIRRTNYAKIAIHKQVGIAFNYIIPFILTFFISVSVFVYIRYTFSTPAILSSSIASIPDGIMSLFQVIFSQAMWYLGIHGENFFRFVFGAPDFLYREFVPSLSNSDLINIFVTNGGSGAGLSLILAIIIGSKDKHASYIGKVATPFAIFNINELLIYGIPIFLNKYLIIPFILVPLANFSIAYAVISTGYITFHIDGYLPWTTPIFLNAYLATDGNLLALLLQLVLTILGTLIYLPFVEKYTKSQSTEIHSESLSNKLGVMTEIEKNEDIKFRHAQSSMISSHAKIDDILDLIMDNKLILYYQPKINMRTNKCEYFESLLRLQLNDGRILPPTFLEDLEDAGLAPIIDIWVCKQVRADLASWSQQDFHPTLSINLNPHTLQDPDHIHTIIEIVKGLPIDFEIIERGIASNYDLFIKHINDIKRHGINISIDDFGAGYSYYNFLYSKKVDYVKLDMSLARDAMEHGEYSIYSHLSKMCSKLNIAIVAEGIETEEQMDILVKQNNIDYVQGYYYSRPLNKDDALDFALDFNG